VEERWRELVEKGVLEVIATDKEVRPYFVALQGIVEHVLAHEFNEKNITTLAGVIHTAMPATPLCALGNVSSELLDPSLVDPTIAEDPVRLLTVKIRATIIRDYLFQGGDLYIAYPKEGFTKRSGDQQKIYKQELESYPSHLFDRPLDCESIDKNLSGAFYLFKKGEGEVCAFAIKMTQANDPLESGSFGLWFGELNQSSIFHRVSEVLDYVHKYSPQPIPLPL
jgi:hypothetical protein